MDVIELLLEFGADINAADSSQETPLHYAFEPITPHIEVIRLLLDWGANTAARDEDGNTVLHKACRKDLTEAFELLEANGGGRYCQGQGRVHPAPRGGRVSRTRDCGPAAGKRRRHQRNQPQNENTAAHSCDKPVAPGGGGDVGGRRSRRSGGGRLRGHAPAPGRRPEVVSTGLKGPDRHRPSAARQVWGRGRHQRKG